MKSAQQKFIINISLLFFFFQLFKICRQQVYSLRRILSDVSDISVSFTSDTEDRIYIAYKGELDIFSNTLTTH